MGWNGSGTFTRTNGDNTGSTTWQQDKADGDKILASRHDTHDQDLADGINSCLAKNGENSMTANLDMGGFLIQNYGTTGNNIPEFSSGTFIPALNQASDWTISTSEGSYIKIGNIVFVTGKVVATRTASIVSSKPLVITNLPFAAAKDGSCNISKIAGIPTNGVIGSIDSGATEIDVLEAATTEVSPNVYTQNPIYIDDLGDYNNTFIVFSCQYETS